MPLTALIIDDEPLARQELQYLLDRAGGVEVLAQGTNGIEAVDLIQTHQPDLVFLDVQMPGLDGFAVLKKLLDRKVRMPQVVFATAFNQYAVRAFEVNAVDYLLKPFDQKRVMQTIEKAAARLTAPAESASDAKLDALLRLMEEQSHGTKSHSGKVIVRAQNRLLLVNQKEICFASIEEGIITVVTPTVEGPLQLPHTRGADRPARPGDLLACAPLVRGQHPAHPRGRAVVQIELSATHGRPEEDRNPGKPRADEAVARAV